MKKGGSSPSKADLMKREAIGRFLPEVQHLLRSDVTLAGQVGVAGHLTIGDGAVATAQTGIPNSVEPGAMVSGYPAIENRQWLKASAAFVKLPDLKRRVRDLEERLAALEAGLQKPR